ncbi:2-oxo-4-hydroxy-4-carboxy-5-ureidoimidazoline decarboxylase [Streptomyces sp. NRRL F-5135]|uniref:2-oxo-4-hydroxy-4-carboxy-5-ureidoimidazoline decarboxylase n=1 Tax=Streptomyces sp. NRRL F-5135 TaxID=1463858 RepID=UPI00099DC4BC|nr:2-oxo-4-hydroxy-4-carboxy-5-ureidoimidazoline decarboxylase [Streptomyces sp. NRRL F-5135]
MSRAPHARRPHSRPSDPASSGRSNDPCDPHACDPHTGAPHACGLDRFNTAPRAAVEAALLTCCGSRRWARRVADHRPYPGLDALLAAADEASYDLSPAEISDALAGEPSPVAPAGAPPAARTALTAAHAAYESNFGHAFVISLDGRRPEEYLDHVLAGIHARLSHDPDHERAVAADELRRVARARIVHLLSHPQGHRAAKKPTKTRKPARNQAKNA